MRFVKMVWRATLPFLAVYSDFLIQLIIRVRLWARSVRAEGSVESSLFSMQELPVFVINLDKRQDRKIQVLENLAEAGFRRVEVVSAVDGSLAFPNLPSSTSANLGCTASHLKVIEEHCDAVTPIAICEDDNQFLVNGAQIQELLSLFAASAQFDVLCLSARVRGPRVKAIPGLDAVGWALAPSFYVIKPVARKRVLSALRVSRRKLLRERRRGPFDQVWRWTQRFSLIFVVPSKRVSRQRESFSDIQGRYFGGT